MPSLLPEPAELTPAPGPARPPRPVGTVRLGKTNWIIECEPHVRQRLKQLFPRISKSQFEEITIRATPEASRDLEWFLQRYPMTVTKGGARLERLAREYDARIETTARILAGEYEPPAFEQMAKPPRRYQAEAVALAMTNRGLLCGDELGLGKTITAIAMLTDPATLPALVVVPTHIQRQWADKVREFAPHLVPHILKKGTPYELDEGLFGEAPDVIITTYFKLSGWADHLGEVIRSVVFDECQELRRRDSQKYQAALHLAHSADYRLGLSATPIYNYGEEWWSVFQVLCPDALGSRQEFLREWCSGFAGKERLDNPPVFGSYLRDQGLMIRRTRKDVGRELPSLNRVVHEIESAPDKLDDVADAAAELAKIVLGQGGGFEKLKASQELSHQLRQATGIAKAPFVAEFVHMLLEDSDDPVVLFGWHRAVYEIWAYQLAEWKPAWYTGTESPAAKQRSIEKFLSGESRVLMMSLRSGSGVDGLQEVCSRVVIGELDWSPGALEQCVGRVHRDGQEEPVFVYYLTANEGSDPVMVDVLGLKKSQIDGVREPHGELTVAKEVDPEHVKKLAESYLASRGIQRIST